MQVLDAVYRPARAHDRAAVEVGGHAAGARRVVVTLTPLIRSHCALFAVLQPAVPKKEQGPSRTGNDVVDRRGGLGGDRVGSVAWLSSVRRGWDVDSWS
jgi:hypothetical protein